MTVRIGTLTDQKEFIVYEGTICARSEFFRRALNGNWAESEERLVRLTEDEPAIFAIYLNHVYTNQLATIDIRRDRQDTEAEFDNGIREEYVRLSKLYVLCKRLQDVKGKNAITLAILAVSKEKNTNGSWYVPPAKEIMRLYGGTPENAPIRKLVVDIWTSVSPEVITKNFDRLPKEFLRYLAIAGVMKLDYNSNPAKNSDGSPYLEKEESS